MVLMVVGAPEEIHKIQIKIIPAPLRGNLWSRFEFK